MLNPALSPSLHHRYWGAGHPGGLAEHVKVIPVPSAATGLSGEILARPGLCLTKIVIDALPIFSILLLGCEDGFRMFTARHVYDPADSEVTLSILNTLPVCLKPGCPSRSHSTVIGEGFAETLQWTISVSPSSASRWLEAPEPLSMVTMGGYWTSRWMSASPAWPRPLSAVHTYLPASSRVTRWMVWVKAVAMKRPFLVHRTLLTFGLASTVHCKLAVASRSTRSGFSGPTSTRGKSETNENVHFSLPHRIYYHYTWGALRYNDLVQGFSNCGTRKVVSW